MGRFETDQDIIQFEKQFCSQCLLRTVSLTKCKLLFLHAKYEDDPVLDELIIPFKEGNYCTLFMKKSEAREIATNLTNSDEFHESNG